MTAPTSGLCWLPKSDQFYFKVKAKILIQHLWQHELDWDEPLPEPPCTAWNSFRNGLEGLNNFNIPRHIYNNDIPPLKRQTLPRLELCAADLAAQLSHKVKGGIKLKHTRHLWPIRSHQFNH